MRVNLAAAVLLVLSIPFVACGESAAQEPGRLPTPATARQPDAAAKVSKAVDELVAELRQHPIDASRGAGRIGLILIKADGGEATRIAEETDPGLNRCGSPVWSSDGRRILFDVTPGNKNYSLSRIKGLELVAGRLSMIDLGLGNCPYLSPADDRVIFVLNSGGDRKSRAGVWMMNTDGSGRHRLDGFGRPQWSPDGHQFAIVSFSDPCEVTVIDDRPGKKSGLLRIPDMRTFHVPRWVEPGTMIAVLGEEKGDRIALIDVSDPEQAKVTEVLWSQAKGPEVDPYDPVYSSVTRRCYFSGKQGANGSALYVLEQGKADPPKQLEVRALDNILLDLTLSPDGRYLVFRSDRDGRPE